MASLFDEVKKNIMAYRQGKRDLGKEVAELGRSAYRSTSRYVKPRVSAASSVVKEDLKNIGSKVKSDVRGALLKERNIPEPVQKTLLGAHYASEGILESARGGGVPIFGEAIADVGQHYIFGEGSGKPMSVDPNAVPEWAKVARDFAEISIPTALILGGGGKLGTPKLAMGSVGVSTAIGTGLFGQPLKESVKSGIRATPALGFVGNFTNPLIEGIVATTGLQINNPIVRQLAMRSTNAVLNIMEGVPMDIALSRQPLEMQSVVIDGISGFLLLPGTNEVTTKNMQKAMKEANVKNFDDVVDIARKEGDIASEEAVQKVRESLTRLAGDDEVIRVKTKGDITGWKTADDLVTFENATDRARIDEYKRMIQAGEEIDPLLVIREADGRYSVEDGKHRLQAMKELGIDLVPTKLVAEVGASGKAFKWSNIKDIIEDERGFVRIRSEVKPDDVKNPKMKVPEERILHDKILKTGGGTYNLADLETTDEVLKMVESTAKKTSIDIEEARRGSITNQQTRRLANQLGITEETLSRAKKGKAYTAEELVRIGDIMKTKFERLTAMSKEIEAAKASGTLTPVQKMAFLREQQEASLILSKVLGAETEAGRALQALQIIKKTMADPRIAKVEDILKRYGIEEGQEDIITRFLQLDATNPEEAFNYLRNLNKMTTPEKVLEYWFNAILSRPATHFRNLIGNTIATIMSPAERLITAGVDTIDTKMRGVPKQAYAGEAMAEIFGATTGMREALQKSLEIMKKGYSLDDVSKLEIRGMGAKLAPTRLLVASDAFFRTLNFNMAINAETYRKAAGEGLTGKALADRITELKNELPEDILNKADILAADKVFQAPPGEFTKKLLALRETPLKVAGKEIPVLKFLFPFIQTPANLLKFGMKRTPLGFLELLTENKSALERKEILGRALLGSGLMAVIASYAWDGKISGPAPTSKTQRDLLRSKGWQPWSIKVGDKWVSYKGLEPLNQIFAQVALMREAFVNNGDAPTTEQTQQLLLGIMENLVSQSYMSGIASILNAIEDPERYGGSVIENLAGSFVPGAVADITHIMDPMVRDPEGAKEAVMARLPGLSKQLPPAIDSFGKPIERTQQGLGVFSPTTVTKEAPSATRTGSVESLMQQGVFAKQARETKKGERQAESQAILNLRKELDNAKGQQEILAVLTKAQQDGLLNKDTIEDLLNSYGLGSTSPEKTMVRTLTSNDERADFILKTISSLNSQEEILQYLQTLQEQKVLTPALMDTLVKRVVINSGVKSGR